MNIRTILFDLDGTLIDTNELIIDSFLHTFAHYGYHFSREEVIEFNGPPLKETFEKIDAKQAEAMINTYRKHNLYHHNAYVKPFPHVMETIEILHEKKYKLGIVTAKMRKSVEPGLEITGLAPYFETIITVDDVDHAKPHPEPVLKAMEDLGGIPETTLMIGDNSHDIEAGKNAGVWTAGVAWSIKGKDFLNCFHPSFMLEDMRDLLDILGV